MLEMVLSYMSGLLSNGHYFTLTCI